MAEYISREAAIESFRKNLDGGYVLTDDAQTTHILQSLPAVDVRPVVRGRWIKNTYEYARELWDAETKCSLCGYTLGGATPNFCPNCGADMREKS